jgi:hypothetical protein
MAELQFPWARNSWTILTKIIRAWYSVETGGGEVTQKKIAEVAGVQQSQVSTNKPFLQAIGVISAEGTAMTEAGKRLGIGLYNENESMRRQGLEQVIKATPILKDMLEIVRGRGSLKTDDFYAEVALRIGGRSEGFVTGTAILIQILTLSGAVEIADNTIRPSKSSPFGEPTPLRENAREVKELPETPVSEGLKRIPIAVSTSKTWWVEVAEKPEGDEVEKFLAMQKLMFGIK